MNAIASNPGAGRLFVLSLVARVPHAMLSIGLLVHTRHLTGSYADAGLVAGVYAVALGVGGPVLGRLVDRRGQARVLLLTAVVQAVLLMGVALVPAGAAPGAVIAFAAGIGLASPPVGECLRSLLPGLLAGADAVRAAFALEATASELTWIAGPPAGLALGAAWSTGGALAVAGLVMLAATAAFAAQPATRAWRPVVADGPRRRGGSLRAPAMQTLVLVLLGVGALFGAAEVGVAATADALGTPGLAGPLLGLWGAGSLIGGLVATRLGGGARGATGLALLVGALCAGHLALAAAGSAVALAAVLLVAGAAIAPVYATVYAIADRVAPAGTATEAFAWLTTAVAVGASIGAAGAGAVADHAGPPAAFVLAGGAGAVALLALAVGGRALGPRADAVTAPAVAPVAVTS
jgi:predicted MFS family arabinose efflux permease